MSGFFRHISLWVLATVFSWSTVLLASGPFRALRLASPFWVFWPVTAAISGGLWFAGLPFVACSFAAIALVIGLFTEIEGWGVNRGWAAIGSLVTLSAAVGTAFGAWCRFLKMSPATWLSKWIEPMVLKMKELYPSLEFDVDLIVSQVPSVVIVLGLVALAIAIVSERTWLRFIGSGARPEELSSRKQWTSFRLWDLAIYVLMLALLAALTRHGVKSVTIAGANVLNVMVVLYFFQGMAVVFRAFRFYGIGPFWRTLIGFVLTFQLAILVAILGVADYWLEIRRRFDRVDGPNRSPVEPKAEL